MMTEVVMLNR